MARSNNSDNDDEYDLITLDGFREGVRAANQTNAGGIKGLYCPQCGEHRRIDVEVVHLNGRLRVSGTITNSGISGGGVFGPDPTSVFELKCVQCQTTATALVYLGPSGPDLVILWSQPGGLRTPNTPDSVAYYLDQAARAESVGARTAAVAMYRAAVEQLLLEQGYRAKMLGPKLGQLDAAIAANTAPKWATELASDFMDVLRDLGNAAIHAGDGDVTKQAEIDTKLLIDIRIVLERLLESVYERPKHDAALLARLRSKADKVK